MVCSNPEIIKKHATAAVAENYMISEINAWAIEAIIYSDKYWIGQYKTSRGWM